MAELNLTPKQESFCQLYIELGNASEAYRQSYDADSMNENTVHVKASELKKLRKIQDRIKYLTQHRSNEYFRNSAIKVDSKTYERIKNHFSSNDDAEKWASHQLAKASLELGIKLNEIVRPTVNESSRYSVLHRAGFKCQACGEKPRPANDIVLHIDHIIPFSLGGTNEPSNLQVLCNFCNISKGNRFSVDHNF